MTYPYGISATTAFAARGYVGTTARDVAAVTRVNRALVSYYFTDKADLLAATIEPTRGLRRSRSPRRRSPPPPPRARSGPDPAYPKCISPRREPGG